MSFTFLLPNLSVVDALTELQKKFGEARASLVRIRADRVRLARTGWRPRAPSETKLIRAAEWSAAGGAPVNAESSRIAFDFDLESRFVPTESAFREYADSLDRSRSEGRASRVFLRGIELDEPRFLIAGRPVCAAFFDFALALDRHPGALIVLPKVDGYLEARFWAEVARTFEVRLGLPRDSIRLSVALETLGGFVEAEEILFELKDSVFELVYDARLDRLETLRLESGLPVLPKEDPSRDPWAGLEIATRTENLESLARRRGVRLDLRPDGGLIRERTEGVSSSVLTLESLREKAGFSFRFLREWFGGNANPEGKDWVDFELARSLLWTAIHSGFLREENFEAWREEFGPTPFEPGSVDEAAIRTLDPLVRTGVFPDSARPLAFSVLLERERTRSVNHLRHA